MPEYGSETFDNLCRAIAQIAQSKGISDITIELVKENFIACDNFVATDRELLRQNFNTLIASLNINLTRLCQYTNYDASAIFRIRNGTRKPGDSIQFASSIASFVSEEMSSPSQITAVAELMGCPTDEIQNLCLYGR